MRERAFVVCLLIVGCALFGLLWVLEVHSPRIEATSEGYVELIETNMRDEAVLLSGWEVVPDGYALTLSLDNAGVDGLYLALPAHADVVPYLDGALASVEPVGSFSLIKLPDTGAVHLVLERSASARWDGSNRSVFIGGFSALLELAQVASLVRMLVVGVDLAALIYALSLYGRKPTEKYLLAFAAYAVVTLLRVARRAIPLLLTNDALNLLFEFHVWQASTEVGERTLTSIWLIMIDVFLRYRILKAFFSTKIGSIEYVWMAEGVCVVALLAATFLCDPMVIAWAPVTARFVCPCFEFFVLVRAYGRGNRAEAAPILVAWICMFAVLVFNRLSEMGMLGTYSIGTWVGLGGIHDSLLLLGFLGAISARFAGKFTEAERYSVQLQRANGELQEAVDYKTREIQESYDKLKESQRQKDEFLSMMAHNVKTPLFSICGYSEMAEEVLVSDPAAAEKYLGAVRKNVHQVESMFQGLLLSSQLETKRLRFDPIPLDLARVVERVVEVMQPEACRRGVVLKVLGDTHGVLCMADGTYIAQAFENIIDNAIKSCGDGGSVTIGLGALDGFVRVEVVDTGSGIAAEDLSHVFERYWSSRRGAQGGTGLGLPIAQDIVEQNGGRIRMESVLGQGSTVTVEFPLEQNRELLSQGVRG